MATHSSVLAWRIPGMAEPSAAIHDKIILSLEWLLSCNYGQVLGILLPCPGLLDPFLSTIAIVFVFGGFSLASFSINFLFLPFLPSPWFSFPLPFLPLPPLIFCFISLLPSSCFLLTTALPFPPPFSSSPFLSFPSLPPLRFPNNIKQLLLLLSHFSCVRLCATPSLFLFFLLNIRPTLIITVNREGRREGCSQSFWWVPVVLSSKLDENVK